MVRRAQFGSSVSNPRSVEADDLSGDVFARNFDGADLSHKVDAAQTYLESAQAGQGRIIITPPADGSEWDWSQDLTFDFVGDDYGLNLVASPSTVINYTGSGWPITIDASDSGGINVASQSSIVGGKWNATGSETGWLRLIDCFRTHVAPTEVRFESGTGVEMRNESRWTENTILTGSYRVARGFNFVPQSQTGGTGGTDSFHDTVLMWPQISASDYCIRTSGVFQYVSVFGATFQPTASGGDCILFDHQRAEGTGFYSCKCESPANPGNVAAINSTARFNNQTSPDPTFYPPGFVQNRLNGFGIDEIVRTGSDADPPRQYSYGGRHIWGYAGSGTVADLDRSGNLQIHGTITENATDGDLFP